MYCTCEQVSIDHFATFPPELPEICIKAGTSERGQCPVCGSPWERVVDYEARYEKRQDRGQPEWKGAQVDSSGWKRPKRELVGWRPTCKHDAEPVPQIVLDPFAGSGTTVMVAQKLGRIGIGLDLSWDYLQLARERTGLAQMDAWTNGRKIAGGSVEDLPLFAGK
ncbi:site-specific DNA-methyltransferase [bacterium]|nr:site-specific DNA-methyltransferase [bacterium]